MIIVTGASKGLGRAICERLYSKKIPVLGLSRTISNGAFESMQCDITSYDAIKAISLNLKKKKLRITGLINTAGISSMNLAVTTPPKITQQIINTNLIGTIYCCQIFTPLMFRNREGFIINFSTIAVSLGLKGESVYIASKAGIEGFTRSFAREVADFNIKVNCISPGPIETDLIKGISKKNIANIISNQIITRQFTQDTIADLVEVLIDARCSSLSGQVFHVGGS